MIGGKLTRLLPAIFIGAAAMTACSDPVSPGPGGPGIKISHQIGTGEEVCETLDFNSLTHGTNVSTTGLTIFGTALEPGAAELREAAEEAPDLQLRLYGGFEPAFLPVLLADADLMLVPSLVPETFSIVVREAFACGLPVIASRIGALPEAIRDGSRLARTARSNRWEKGVCTMCTPWASDWAVHGADRAGFRMFPRVPSVFKGWNAVRVPPRARITPRQRGFCFNVWTLVLHGSL